MATENQTVQLSNEELQKQIEQLKAEIAARKADDRAQFRIAVGQSGAVSVYGLGSRFPTSLYSDQWSTLLSHASDVLKFLADNKGQIDAAVKAHQKAKIAERVKKEMKGA